MGEVVELERQWEGKSWLNRIRKGNEREGGREKYLDENQEGEALARAMAHWMWRGKLDSKIARLLELILREKLSKIAKGRDLLSLLEMLLEN